MIYEGMEKRLINIEEEKDMRKRILSFLLSVVMATSISSTVPMSVQAETTTKTAVQSAKTAVQSATVTTTYGSNTNPGEVAAKDIKEWRDKANENDILPGWYHFKGEETNWKSIEFWPDKENTMKDYEADKILMTFKLWKNQEILMKR